MWKIFKKKKETNEEIRKRIFGLCYNNTKNYGICSPPMKAQVALDELARHLLGEDWHVVMPVSQDQVNTEIVYQIESKYNKVIKKK